MFSLFINWAYWPSRLVMLHSRLTCAVLAIIAYGPSRPTRLYTQPRPKMATAKDIERVF